MTIELRIFMILVILLYFAVVVHLLRKKLLLLRYSLLWLGAGVVMLVMAIFPGILDFIAAATGVYAPTNALFAMLIFCMLCILVSITSIVSKNKEREKRLTQQLALLEERVRRLEADRELSDRPRA